MQQYRYVLDEDVAELVLALSKARREELIRIFRELAANPFQAGESCFRDTEGREIQNKQYQTWLLSFWSDHAMKEIRIVGIQKRLR